MSLVIGQFISIIKLLHSENGASQIAAGLTIGFFMGLSPLFTLQGAIFIFLLLLLRVQIGAAIAMSAVTKLTAILLTPFLSSIGQYFLTNESFNGFYTTLYNLPLVPFSKFNHSVVMGGLVLSIVLGPVLYLIFYRLILSYQEQAVQRLKKTKFFKAIKASSLVQWYLKYERITK